MKLSGSIMSEFAVQLQQHPKLGEAWLSNISPSGKYMSLHDEYRAISDGEIKALESVPPAASWMEPRS
jgi:hypothetical protein